MISPAAPPLTEEHLARLVQLFYERARTHPGLGPLFNTAVADGEHHLGVVQDFWSHALLGEQRYQSYPYPLPLGLPIRRNHFDQWLDLFRPAALKTLPGHAAARSISRAKLMAASFFAGQFTTQGGLSLTADDKRGFGAASLRSLPTASWVFFPFLQEARPGTMSLSILPTG